MTIAALSVPLLSFSQTDSSAYSVAKVHRQQSFGRTVPHGDYSGIAYIGNERYAVVSDKSSEDGFFIFHIVIDSVTGRIKSVADEGFRSATQPNRDQEGITFAPETNTLFISGEADNRIKEYSLDGKLTGREIEVPQVFASATSNYGFESLTYNSKT